MGTFSISKLAEKAAISIFMHSHSGGTKNGATDKDLKRSICNRNILSAVVDTALSKLRENLFYLNEINGQYLFTKDANLLKMKKDGAENLKREEIDDE